MVFSQNRCVFSNWWNSRSVSSESHRWTGRLFHGHGPAAMKDRSPRLVRVLATLDDGSRCRPVVVMSWQLSIRYRGDKAFNNLKTRSKSACAWHVRDLTALSVHPCVIYLICVFCVVYCVIGTDQDQLASINDFCQAPLPVPFGADLHTTTQQYHLQAMHRIMPITRKNSIATNTRLFSIASRIVGLPVQESRWTNGNVLLAVNRQMGTVLVATGRQRYMMCTNTWH